LIFIHIEHTFCICPFLAAFFSATIDGRNLIFGDKLHIDTPYRGKRFWTHRIPTSSLPRVQKRFPKYGIPIWSLWRNIRFLSSIVAEKNATKNVHIQIAFLDPSDSYFLFADLVGFYTHWTYMHIFHHIFSATIDGRNLIFCHKLHIGTPYRGKRFWTHQIPTSCLPTLLEKWAYMFNVYKNQLNRQTGSRNLTGPKTLPIIWHTNMKLVTTPYRGKRFWTHQIPTSCLPTLLNFIHI
jgi:hypothetical protein